MFPANAIPRVCDGYNGPARRIFGDENIMNALYRDRNDFVDLDDNLVGQRCEYGRVAG